MTGRGVSRRSQAGFSLVESLFGTLVLMTVTAAVLALLDPSTGAFGTQPEAADVHQRVRVAASALTADLAHAGAPAYGGSLAGGLMDHLAPVLPHRTGPDGDPPGTFRSDVVTVMYVPSVPAQSRVRRVRPDTRTDTIIEMAAGCGGARQDLHCGFRSGMRVVLLGAPGTWDVRTVALVEGDALHLGAGPPLSSSYDGADAVAAQLESHTYYLRTDRAARTYQLMRYDGASTDLPVVDDVVKLQFKYWGVAAPPQFVAGAPPEERRTTYGPRPPALTEASGTAWPDGESCTFAVADGAHVSRLPVLPADASGLVELDAASLTDGPWCPDAARTGRFDADLLRVRRIHVVLRVQAAAASFRGPASSLFMHAGTARPSRYVPDVEIRFDVSPRNMSLER